MGNKVMDERFNRLHKLEDEFILRRTSGGTPLTGYDGMILKEYISGVTGETVFALCHRDGEVIRYLISVGQSQLPGMGREGLNG